MTIEKLEKHLLHYSDTIAKGLTISDKTKADHPDLYHISIDPSIKKFIPRISDYQLPGEDRSVPRVVTASSLLGCILGYAHIQNDYLKEPEKVGVENVGKHFEWNNGYYIYSLNYDLAVKPTDDLVAMATQTDETWLVAYSPENTEYTPKRIGKFFVREFKFGIKDNTTHEVETIILIEVLDENGIQFSKNQRLTKGYWEIEMSDVGAEAWKSKSWVQDEEIKIKAITREDWLASKNAIASMLGHQEMDSMIQAPAYVSW